MRYRVEQLAAACDVSVDTVRYYQSRGLLPQPEREGRVAVVRRRARGAHPADPRAPEEGADARGDRAGRSTASSATPTPIWPPRSPRRAGAGGRRGRPAHARRLRDAERRARVADPGRRARGHPDRPRRRRADAVHGRRHRTRPDRAAPARVRAAARRPARRSRATRTARSRELAARAVDLFDEHVRKPIRDSAGDDAAAAAQMVEAFNELLPAVTTLVSHHFRRVAAGDRRGADRDVTDALPQGEEKARSVRDLFDTISPRYDLVNRVMTFGMDIGLAPPGRPGAAPAAGRAASSIWPAGPGTCPSSSRVRATCRPAFDFSFGMLANARTDVPLVQADILRLPVRDASADGVDVRVRAAQRGLARGAVRGARARGAVRAGPSRCSTRAVRTTRCCAPDTRCTSSASCR